MLVRFAYTRLLIVAVLGLLLLALAACDTGSPATSTPVAPATDATATPRPPSPNQTTPGATLPASPPTAITGQMPTPQLTGPAGQVPPPQPTGSPALVTPGAVDPDDPPRVTLQELQQLLTKPDTLLVDVRSNSSFQERHIKGAVSYPFTTIDTRIQDVPRDKFIVAYCQ